MHLEMSALSIAIKYLTLKIQGHGQDGWPHLKLSRQMDRQS